MTPKKLTKNREKKFEIILAQNCLKRIMSQLLEYTKKIEKKLFLVQNFLKRKMSQLLDYTKKLTKNRENNRKIIFGSEFSETNNEPTFG